MKYLAVISTFMILQLSVCAVYSQQKTYNLTTPQKFVESLCTIGEAPADSHAVNVFYERKSAALISAHDSAIISAKNSFESFKNLFKEIFPERIVNIEDNGIEIKMSGMSSDNTSISFIFSGYVISEQLASYKKGNFKYISCRPISDTISVITVVKNGKAKDLPVVKEDSNYKMRMDTKSLAKMKKLTITAIQLDKVFGKCAEDIDSGKLNPKNYEKIVMGWARAYNKVMEAEKKE